jgi:hypothetical protein
MKYQAVALIASHHVAKLNVRLSSAAADMAQQGSWD